ncbi:MAG: glycosyltransferase family 2 protein [Variovorax sp.]
MNNVMQDRSPSTRNSPLRALRPDSAARPGDPPAGRSISCVIPCFNEAANLELLLPTLEEMLWSTRLRWEIIVVDDGSTDHTDAVVAPWCELEGFRCVSLSRNFGKEAALTAGLKAASGDAVVMLDGDMQHPPALIGAMVQHWLAGADVVHATRAARDDEGPLKRWGTRLFYRLVNASHRFQVTEDAGDFRLMDRKVVDALLSLPERSRFMKGLYAWVGFKAVSLPYVPAPRAHGRTHFDLGRLARLAVDGMTAFTTWPLRVVSVVGLLLALLSFAYGVYVIAEYLMFGNRVSGWATLVVSLMFFFGIQMLSMGILGEYVARIFDEVKSRPLYIVLRERGRGLKA